MSHSFEPTMTCEEILRSLNEYIDDETAAVVCSEFSEHLVGCHTCQIVIDNVRQTIRLVRDGGTLAISAESADRLQRRLAEFWKRRYSSNPS